MKETGKPDGDERIPRTEKKLEPKAFAQWLETFFFSFFFFFRVTPMAYGSSQARGQIRVAAASLHLSHSNTTYKPFLQPTLLLRAMPDP